MAALSASCATTPDEPNDLCDHMAAFANAAANDGTHTVRLMTDWGGYYARLKDPSDDAMYVQSCEHESYAPAQSLCAYLLENTSIEFQGINVRRALHCMGKRASGRSPTDDDRLPASARSHEILGVPVGSELLLEFTRASDTTPPTLGLTAVGR
jgi:hypothetical protein